MPQHGRPILTFLSSHHLSLSAPVLLSRSLRRKQYPPAPGLTCSTSVGRPLTSFAGPAAAIMFQGCLSFTASRDWCYRQSFSAAGLRSSTTNLEDGTTFHCWVPKTRDATRPALLLIHGFGANATWQWSDHLRPLILAGFDVYVPDLLFFGSSASPEPDRSEVFQARCVAAGMETLGVKRMSLVGISYGGFVGYRIAALFPERVHKVVLCCSGVCLEERDLQEGLFVVSDVAQAAEILLPQTPTKLRELMGYSFVKPPGPPRVIPSCFLSDYIDVMCTEYLEEKTQLIHALIKDRKLSDLPKITQPTLIVWGEQDRIFPLELGNRLHRHLEGNSQLVVIKNAGHAVNLEKAKEFCKYLKAFLVDSPANSCPNQKEKSLQLSSSSSFKWLEKRSGSLRPLWEWLASSGHRSSKKDFTPVPSAEH